MMNGRIANTVLLALVAVVAGIMLDELLLFDALGVNLGALCGSVAAGYFATARLRGLGRRASEVEVT